MSLSCGSVTLASTADAPGSPNSPTSHHLVHHDTPPSRQDTLSPSPSLPCSPEQQQQQQQQQHQQQSGQSIRDSLQNLRDFQHKHLSPIGRDVASSDLSEMSEFIVGRVGSRLSITSKSSSGGKRGSIQQSFTPMNNMSPPPAPDTASPTGSAHIHSSVVGRSGSIHSPTLEEMLEAEENSLREKLASFPHYSSYYDDLHYGDGGDDSGDNLSHESYDLIEREEAIGNAYPGGSHGGSLMGSRGPSRASSRGLLSSISGDLLSSSREGLEWCESKGGGDMPVSRGSSRAGMNTGSLPRSHGGSVTTIINGCTGSLPRAHSVSQSGQLSRTLAGSRASSRITLELPLDTSPDKEEEEDDDLSSPGSPEFHENSVCEITSEKGYTRHLGTITITDNVSLFNPQLPSRRPGLERTESLTDSLTFNSVQRSRSNSRSKISRGSRENLIDGSELPTMSMSTMSTRVSASIRAAKDVGQYVDYGSSQESLKMSSCESDVGSSMSSQTRSSTTPRPSDFQPHVSFLPPARRSTSTSPPTITSGSSQPMSSQPRPRSMDFASLHKKQFPNVHRSGRGSDSGGNTDSDICSPLEIHLPMPSTEQVKEIYEEEEEESLTPQDHLLFLPKPPDIGLITRIHGSSDDDDDFVDARGGPHIPGEEDDEEEIMCEHRIMDEDDRVGETILEEDEYIEEEEEEEIKIPEVPRLDNDKITVVIEENSDPFLFSLKAMPHHELKEESPSSADMDFTDTSRDRKIDESEASERTVIERYHLPDDRLNKVGSKDSQMSIEEIDEAIMDRRSSLGLERRSSYNESRKSPYLDRRYSTQELERISPLPDKDRRPSYQEGERRSPYLEADQKSSTQDLSSRRSPFSRDRTPSNSSDRSRRGSNSSDRHGSISSERHASISSDRTDRRGSGSSDHKPSLSDIGRRTSISVENDQRSPFIDTPAFEFDPPGFEFENENVFDSIERDVTPPTGTQQPPVSFNQSAGNETEHSKSYLDQSKINVDDITEALLPPEDSSDTFSSISGARVVEVVEINSEGEVKKISSPTLPSRPAPPSKESTPKQTPQHTPSSSSQQQIPMSPTTSHYEEVHILDKPPKKPQRDVIIIKVDVENAPQETEDSTDTEMSRSLKRTIPKIEDMSGSSYESNPDSQDKSRNGDDSLEVALSGGPRYHHRIHEDIYDDVDDHAQMSDHSSQSPDLVSDEPDEYHDEYQEPEYYQPYRQMDMGYAFPSRTLSRISERSTTSEQEHEQDHVHSEHEIPDNELTDSKISTPTEDKHGGDHPSDIPSDLSSDYSNSNCDDGLSESKHSHSHSLSQSQTKSHSYSSVHPSSESRSSLVHSQVTTSSTVSTVNQPSSAASGTLGTLTAEEQENVNKFATHLFLSDLPEFAGDDSDEFPSPPSSAFLENPHAELRLHGVQTLNYECSNIESYYLDIAQQANSKLVREGIYDNIPVKFEGIHEVSESESGSEENHTLQEPEDEMEVLEDLKNIKDLDDDADGSRVTPTPESPEHPPKPPPHATKLDDSPPPPPPRSQTSSVAPRKSTVSTIGGGPSSMSGLVGSLIGTKPKIKPKPKIKTPSPPVSPRVRFQESPESSSREDKREFHLPDLPGSPPSLSSLDSPDSQALSRLPPYLPMLPSTPPSVSSLDSPNSQIFVLQPASPPASFANPESPCESTSESSSKLPMTDASCHDSIAQDSSLSSEEMRRQEELRHLDIVDFGQQPDDLELNFQQQKEIADLEMADMEHQRSLSGAELIEFQQQREMANIAIANLASTHSEMSDFDLSPTSPFDMIDFSELSGDNAFPSSSSGVRSSGAGVTALDFEVIGGQLEDDRRRSVRNGSGASGTTSDTSRNWS